MNAAAHSNAELWFEKACRAYIEEHQACPWCQGRHCVFRSRRPDREQFCCYQCDFFCCHVYQANLFLVTPGTTPFPGGE